MKHSIFSKVVSHQKDRVPWLHCCENLNSDTTE